ncbi:ciliogenesis and planar polarity effector 1 isoform X1 [Tiliqua scincoides]|uniref:ciliogenesis and planar polarity effector 1 isoform X1 n=1 Tax=Tiliqua scincoides TaxID=71010 RepID=UPI003461C82E
MRLLLLDSAQRLDKLHHSLINAKSKGRRQPLQSLSSLRANLLQYHQNQSSALSAIPKFLQKEGITEQNGEVTGLQDYDEDSDDDKHFQSHSFILESQKANIFVSDEGRLEFASTFDTIHAVDGTGERDGTTLELNCIQKNLIAAWRVGISRSIEGSRDTLLVCTIRCMTHFFSILQYTELKVAHWNSSFKNKSWIHCVLKCFQQLLILLSWEGKHSQTLGHLLKLTLQTIKLMLAEQQNQLFSNSLLGVFALLKMVTHCLNSKNVPQYEVLLAFLDVTSSVELDSIVVPVFQDMDWSSQQHFSALNSILKLSPPTVNLSENREKRLIAMWRLLYKHVLWYQAQLNKAVYISSTPETETQIVQEGQMTEALAGHVQAILQSSGERLEQTLKLNPVTGEEQFLVGSYKESVEAWERALQETKGKGGKRMPYLQTRYYLAILYCHLYHYNLSEAQGLCDHIVSELLKKARISVTEKGDVPDAEQMIRDVHTEAALAVIQSLGRFMASYFTNEPIYVLPPHCIDVLPPLHIRPDRCHRFVPLQHSAVTVAVKDLNLSCVWTVEYALDLLLVGGLIPEAVWLVHKLGDWKMAVSIGMVYHLYCQNHDGFLRSEKVELSLPFHLSPTQIFQGKLQSILGHPVNNETSNEGDPRCKQLTDSVEEEDANVIFSSVEEILKAAVMAEADILSEPFQLLMDSAKELSRKFCGLVPDGLYLPAPPLYCPQPAFLSEEEFSDLPLRMERNYRQKLSGIIQRILLLFQAAHCSFPAAQWYIVQLKQTRKIMQKINKKGALPSLSALPENLHSYSKCHTVFFKPVSSGDHGFDDVSCKAIGCFRELCALCWMLHVREKLSDSCRRYQTARENLENQKDCTRSEFDACIVEHCLTALEWACRMLPFVRFMNVEEHVQDIILSLIGELPPTKKVAEILVKAFPNPEDVRVSLRDKYSALHQRLRHCVVKGPNNEEIMSVVIKTAMKVNLKALKRVTRNIGPPQRNIWEPLEEETQDPGAYCYDRLSLGTSLSRSTISDLGISQVFSDAETADSFSEALLMDDTKNNIPPQKQVPSYAGELARHKRTTEKSRGFSVEERSTKRENKKDFHNQHNNDLPLVGVWEFERDDDEYLKFLDLFLTYLLERDLINHRNLIIPFLTSFSALLREHELNSLFFDVHTTLKRRQIGTKGQNVFRAGSCFDLSFETSGSRPASLYDEKKIDSKKHTFPICIQQPVEHSVHSSVMRFTSRRGLFGLNQQLIFGAQDSSEEITLTPVFTQHFSEQASSLPLSSPVYKYIYKAVQVNDVIQREEPTPELKYKFNSIAPLLEWMIRWSDRRLLCDPISAEPFQEYQSVMHVKTSATAILTSLWLLEQQYCNESQKQSPYLQNPQKRHVRVYSSDICFKLEKESSVDTGYSPSVGTPVGIQDGNAYGEHREGTSGILCEQQSEKEEINVQVCSVMHTTESGETNFDESLREKTEEYLADEVDVASKNEECCGDLFATSGSTTISVSVKSVQRKKEQLSTSDMKCTQKEPVVEMTEGKIPELDGKTGETVPNQVPCAIYPELKTDSPSTDITISNGQTSFAILSSVLSSDPVGPKKEETEARELPAQSLTTSDAVRQMLQDEMFKLVQLQQINFMSLMQIVGSSFANLPNMSQQLQQSQPFQWERNHISNFARTDAEQPLPKHSADGSLKNQMPTLENTWNLNEKNASPQEKSSLHAQNYNRNVQYLQHASDSSSLPESQPVGKRLIPPFQDLLHQVPARPLPLLSVSLNAEKNLKLIPMAKPLNNANGLPLLKLKPDFLFHSLNVDSVKTPQVYTGPFPQTREAWGAPPPPPPPLVENCSCSQVPGHKNGETAHLNLNNYDAEVIKQAQKQKNHWAETINKGPPKHLNLDAYEKKKNVTPSQHLHAHLRAEKPLVEHRIPVCKTYENLAPIPLLHLQQSKYPSALIPLKLTGNDMNSKEPLWPMEIPLLYTNLTPLTKFQTPKLIPLQNLIASEQSCQIVQVPHVGHKDHPEQIQLLKANITPFAARQDRNNKKRQKRRAGKQIKEKEERKKATVTFQQDDSAVLAGIVGETKDNQTGSSHDIIDVNSSLVLKSHQDIQTISEEIDSEFGKSHPVVSASATEAQLPLCVSPALPPDLCLNLIFPPEATQKPLQSPVSDIKSDMAGRKYINVIDIESDDLLKSLPEISAAKYVTMQPEKTEFLTSAKLHHRAASITNAVPPEEFESKGDILPINSFQMPLERVEAGKAGDQLTSSLLHDDFSTNTSTGLLAKKISREHFSAKLQEMDRQLLAIQNMAERMEKEFSNTKLLVRTAENAAVITDSGEDEIPFFAPGVEVCKEDHYSARVIVEDFTNEGLDPESSETNYMTLQTPSASHSASTINLLSVKKSSSDFNYRIEEQDESFSEDPLQMTGLSGVTDIISDLVVESGISAADLGLSESQAKKVSSFSSIVTGRSHKMERDKKELQTWMKKKRKERLAEYLQTRAEQREKEHNPFQLRRNVQLGLTSREIKLQQKKKDEKDRVLLSEHHNRRVSEALSLMHELLADTVQLPASEHRSLSKKKSPQNFKRPHITSTRRCNQNARNKAAAKINFGHTRSFSRLPLDITQKAGHIFQTPDRRMASESSQGETWWKTSRSQRKFAISRLELRSQVSDQTRGSASQSWLPTTDATTQANEESGEDAMSVWSVPDEVQQILHGSYNSHFEESFPQENGYSVASLCNADSVSESTSSILSKLDWNAVEAMVANLEEK